MPYLYYSVYKQYLCTDQIIVNYKSRITPPHKLHSPVCTTTEYSLYVATILFIVYDIVHALGLLDMKQTNTQTNMERKQKNKVTNDKNVQ